MIYLEHFSRKLHGEHCNVETGAKDDPKYLYLNVKSHSDWFYDGLFSGLGFNRNSLNQRQATLRTVNTFILCHHFINTLY